ncbi:hypothetical protein [Propionivibrio soli]|uniref:hypothetical protein n=1 Tax=Propionivibrio soli TaxID=2976531 RepID=UPI0021E9254D|nr:hypothetical protein [Propionivibrio soli]
MTKPKTRTPEDIDDLPDDPLDLDEAELDTEDLPGDDADFDKLLDDAVADQENWSE